MIAVPKIIPAEEGCLVRRAGPSPTQQGWSCYEVTYWNQGRVWRMRIDSSFPYCLGHIAALVRSLPDLAVEVTP